MQLQNIARATGGSYFDAPVGPELPDTLKRALEACKKRVVTLPAKPKPGKLRTTSAIFAHPVFNAETGKQIGTLDRVTHELELAAGIYEVDFGTGALERNRDSPRGDHDYRFAGLGIKDLRTGIWNKAQHAGLVWRFRCSDARAHAHARAGMEDSTCDEE